MGAGNCEWRGRCEYRIPPHADISETNPFQTISTWRRHTVRVAVKGFPVRMLDVTHSMGDVLLPRYPRAFQLIAFPSPGKRARPLPASHHAVPPSLFFPQTSASSCIAKRRGTHVTRGT